MKKVKIFTKHTVSNYCSNPFAELQNDINGWLLDNPNINIISLTQSNDSKCIITILYENI